MKKLRLAGIIDDSITDGAGLRLSVFAQGCNRRCKGCHNPDALPTDGGKEYSVSEIVERARKNPLLSGVTFTGGEPFLQAAAFSALAVEIKKLGLNICIYTGFTLEELLAEPAYLPLLRHADFLVDGEFVLEKRNLSLKFRGSTNQRILDVQKSLEKGAAVPTDNPKWL